MKEAREVVERSFGNYLGDEGQARLKIKLEAIVREVVPSA
jgi:hypothetical protein